MLVEQTELGQMRKNGGRLAELFAQLSQDVGLLDAAVSAENPEARTHEGASERASAPGAAARATASERAGRRRAGDGEALLATARVTSQSAARGWRPGGCDEGDVGGPAYIHKYIYIYYI